MRAFLVVGTNQIKYHFDSYEKWIENPFKKFYDNQIQEYSNTPVCGHVFNGQSKNNYYKKPL